LIEIDKENDKFLNVSNHINDQDDSMTYE